MSSNGGVLKTGKKLQRRQKKGDEIDLGRSVE
jgi:hypothetical protein